VSFNYQKARELPAFAPPADLAPGEYRMQQVDVQRSQEFRKCIECFLCQNVCHVIRDHEDNKPAFAGPRYFIRAAELEMHPLDVRPDRKEMAVEEHGIGYCNITKCCSEVCPEHIKITDNAIIPMKERAVDRRYDPITWLGRKIFRRDQLDKSSGPSAASGADPRGTSAAGSGSSGSGTAVAGAAGSGSAGSGSAGSGSGDAGSTERGSASSSTERGSAASSTEQAAAAGAQGDISMNWHRTAAPGQAAAVGPDGKLPITELTAAHPGAQSPFGDDLEFPMPIEDITYQHPKADEG
jgi:succinate dehydrogenase / fumarate reductase iron-sulfur subunit